jgi:hypothetical protein
MDEHHRLATPENAKRLFLQWSRHWDLSKKHLKISSQNCKDAISAAAIRKQQLCCDAKASHPSGLRNPEGDPNFSSRIIRSHAGMLRAVRYRHVFYTATLRATIRGVCSLRQRLVQEEEGGCETLSEH